MSTKEPRGPGRDCTFEELEDYADNAQERIVNPDGTVTYMFDEPGCMAGEAGGITVSKESYEKWAKEQEKTHPKDPEHLAKVLPFIIPEK